MFETPVLFLIFNRPMHTAKVFEQIREIKPKHLFIAADGPRQTHSEDIEKCRSTRDVVLPNIDWECELHTLLRNENLGCDRGPAEGISWFFSNVDCGIILEDDCLPSISFFYFCEKLLKYYHDEERIMMISGFNPLQKWNENYIDYFFSEGSIWGWATWRRAWNKFDIKMKLYQAVEDNDYINSLIEQKHSGFTAAYKRILNADLDAWDYQWHFARKINNGLSITPSINLVENIGFGIHATHTTWELNPYNGIKFFDIEGTIRYNDVFILDDLYQKKVGELETSKHNLSPIIRFMASMSSIKGKLKKIFLNK